ncbi:TPA: hypothetical protein ACGWHD_002942 [Serratia liquefaciens]|uniref:hypothetical protein n=1 Tax=Serratia liquefaciens TaxID=614 RepID=UPI00165D242E|nr:hypothetical protein [Serratia liquefaciens]QNQ53747.1 hypothetical protein IAI46_21500 [Serratia liquefaciens]
MSAINRFNEIIEIQVSIQNHKDFSLMTQVFAEGLWEMCASNSSFYNYFFKKERIITFNLLMSLVLSNGISSLSEFYTLCGKNKISGKNNTIGFVDYMVRTGRVVFIRGGDRRRKTLALTEKGRKDLDYLFLKKLAPLSIYDSTIDCSSLLTDDFYRNYYKKKNLVWVTSSRHNFDSTFVDSQHFLEIQSKSAGLFFLMKILMDVRKCNVKVGERLSGSYFKTISSKVGVSPSHSLNLIALLVEGGAVEKIGVDYVIRDELLKGVEHIISLNLAVNYLIIKKDLDDDKV